jgi:hypothetical protein
MLDLVLLLLKGFAEGLLPATMVQKIAEAATRDGWALDDPVAQRLGKIGSSGKYQGNCLRDLKRIVTAIGLNEVTPEPYYMKVRGKGGSEIKIPVILPHETLALAVQKHGLDAYRMNDTAWATTTGLSATLRGWAETQEMPGRDVIAVGVHADGVSYSGTQRVGHQKSVLVASFNAISAPLPKDRGRRHLYFAVSKARVCDCGCEGHCADRSQTPSGQTCSCGVSVLS